MHTRRRCPLPVIALPVCAAAAAAVLFAAQGPELPGDPLVAGMFPFIRELESLSKAIVKFNRI